MVVVPAYVDMILTGKVGTPQQYQECRVVTGRVSQVVLQQARPGLKVLQKLDSRRGDYWHGAERELGQQEIR